jgi:hypothetical protein
VSAGHQGVLGSDYSITELIVALCVSLSWLVWTGVLLGLSQLDTVGNAPVISAAPEIPIKVMPVLDMDSPLLKLGGKKRKAVLPDMWRKKPTPTKIKERLAQVSSKAKDDLEDVSPEDLDVSDAGETIAPDAEVADKVDIEDEGADASVEGVGGGSAAGSEHGTETDPLKARAASQYHGRILGFLKSGFSCPALPDGVKKSCRPSASVIIGGDGTVTSVSFNACGNAALDAAAQASISSKRGQQVPPPPENYPELRPNSISVAYVCQ